MRKTVLIMALTAALSACGGGAPGGDTAESDNAVTDNALTASLDDMAAPGNAAAPATNASGAATLAVPTAAPTTAVDGPRARPSFDCGAASGDVERMICTDAGLARRDRALAAAYGTARKAASGDARTDLLAAQRAFLKRRNTCANADCVARAYDDRIAALKNTGGEPEGVVRAAADPDAQLANARNRPGSCLNTAGQKQASLLVRQCDMASAATHPPCNLANSCELMEDEIVRSCKLFSGDDAPAFCGDYLGR